MRGEESVRRGEDESPRIRRRTYFARSSTTPGNHGRLFYVTKENALTCLSFPNLHHTSFGLSGGLRELDDMRASQPGAQVANYPHTYTYTNEPPDTRLPFGTAHAVV